MSFKEKLCYLTWVTLLGGCQQRDVATLKDRAPDQAHTMIEVDYYCTKLWFTGKAENWPLAKFYWSEMVSHMR